MKKKSGSDVLSSLFGSKARVKMLRLFLFNPEAVYEYDEASRKTRTDIDTVRREIRLLERNGILTKYAISKRTKNGRTKKMAFRADTKSPHFLPLQNLLLTMVPLKENEVLKRISGIGKIKLIVISGVFIQDWNTRLDLLIVGDDIKNTKLSSAVRGIEAEMGRELRYAVFTSNDFSYRWGMHDKLLRDIFDFPHQIVVNRLNIDW